MVTREVHVFYEDQDGQMKKEVVENVVNIGGLNIGLLELVEKKQIIDRHDVIVFNLNKVYKYVVKGIRWEPNSKQGAHPTVIQN